MQGISNYDNYRAVRKRHNDAITERESQKAAQLHRAFQTCAKIVTAAIVFGVLHWLAGFGV